MSFEDFKRRIEVRKEDEVFEEWDDFIIWTSSSGMPTSQLKVTG